MNFKAKLLMGFLIFGFWRSPPLGFASQEQKREYGFRLNPGNIIYQGQTLKIEFNEQYAIKPEVRYKQNFIPVFNYQGKDIALVSIDSQESEGIKLISINNFSFSIPILVRKNNFPITYLRPFIPSTSPEFLAEKQRLKELFETIVGNVHVNSGFQKPLENKVIIRSQFGTRRTGKIQTGLKLVRSKTKKGVRIKTSPIYSKHIHVHKGLDLFTVQGKKTKILATNDGTVAIAESFMAEGNFIVINHAPGIYSLYMHLSAINVKPGQFVSKGDLIGLAGNTGNVYGKRRVVRLKNSKKRIVVISGGVHLHFEIKVNGVSVDPVQFMRLFEN